MTIEIDNKTPLTITIFNAIKLVRDMSVKQKIELISVTDACYKFKQLDELKSGKQEDIDINYLDEIKIPESLNSEKKRLLINSIIRHNIKPRKHIGMAEILDYVADTYKRLDEFTNNEPLLVNVLKQRDLYDEMTEALKEIFVHS